MDTVTRPEPRTRVEQVVAGLTERIERGLLRTGERLPSIRAAAAGFAVSKNTVVNAYERLVASGRVESRPGSGFYVSGRRPAPPAPPGPVPVAAVDSVWLLREQLNRHYDVRVGDGRPPPAWMESLEVGRHLPPAAAASESYGSPDGYLPLRRSLALILAERSIQAEPGTVLLTAGANHALDLIIRQFVAPGEPVLVDAPGYYPLFGKLRLAKARIVGVRRNPDGPDVTHLEEMARASGARLFFTHSLAHNPTGCSLTLPVAHRLLQRAGALDLRLVESDPFADVLPAAMPRLAALDQLDRVIYVGTFAKTLSASLRCGYVAARPDVAEALRDLKMVTSVNSSGFVERIVHGLIESGRYRRHLRRLAGRIEAASLQGREVLHALGLPVFGEPRGGYYLWCGLPDACDLDALSRRAAAHGILIAPGGLFLPDGPAGPPMMRVNVAYLSDPRFARFMREEVGGG
ncbi:PLP-dependent aminotransferase family protein [Methylobacterium nonmethylotrophicum]|uniref:8-amino-7-oxononanoate synthase n=1 Tax=Methylobacterium nonmethylotrophicum TaxID=1141884 RepID=A0A4Z0NIK0_9HYPH|nr:PLP-dependent aminotransferase family protein [Methylobacterium nonmethylotrophicum]TGD96163.1 PLP-dependent aminotransferase family protein [Methylobacterium nonmethylotrophicum]